MFKRIQTLFIIAFAFAGMLIGSVVTAYGDCTIFWAADYNCYCTGYQDLDVDGFFGSTGQNIGSWYAATGPECSSTAQCTTNFPVCSSVSTSAPSASLADCNDGDTAIKPGATEICDGVDNNCDGTVDEGCNTAPTITGISNQNIDEDSATSAIAFTVGDAETAAGSLTVSGSSSNTSIVPNGNIIFSGAGTANRTVTVTPAANQNGSAIITLTVNDSGPPVMSASTNFTLTVAALNDLLVNTAIPTFTGNMAVGQTLTKATDGTWNDIIDTAVSGTSTISYSYQWQRANDSGGTGVSDILAATTSSYVLTASDIGKYIRVKVTGMDNGVGTPANQSIDAFSVYKGVPTVTTDTESGVGMTSATLNGTVNAKDSTSVTNIRFQYGTTTGYGLFVTASPSMAAGSSDTAVSATPTDFGAGATYHYRAAATIDGVDVFGTDQTFTTTPMPPPGNALQFDGTDDYVVTVSPVTTATDNVTMEAWVRWSGTGSNPVIIYNGNSSNSGYGIIVNGSVVFILCGGIGVANSSASLTPNVWEHVAAVRNAGTWELYVNGVQESLVGNPSPNIPSGSTLIGSSGASQYFNGQMDEIRIWNTARTQTEIRQNMHDTLVGNEAGLVAYYQFDHASGTTLTDLTANNNNGTLINMAGTEWTAATWNYGYPYVTTGTASSVTAATASVSGTLVDPGTSSLTAKGVCWNTTGTPTTADICTNDGTVTGAYTSSITGLSPDTTYYVCAYAVNSGGTNYGSEISFKTRAIPVIAQVSPLSATMDEDSAPLAWSAPALNASEADGDVMTWDLSGTAANGTATVSGTGASPTTFAYSPNTDFNGSDSFVVRAADADGTDTITVNVTINAINDAPVITGQNSLSTNEDTALTIVSGNLTVTDIDNTYPTGFSLTVLTGTNYAFSGNTITPSANYNGALTVPVKVNDGGLDSNTYNLAVTVNAVNDTPTTTGISNVTVNEDAANSVISLLTSFNDIEDGTGLTYSLQANTNPGLANPSISDGNLTLSYIANANGSASITIRGTDTGGLFVESAFTVTVTAINDTPTTTGISNVAVNEDAANSVINLLTSFDDIEDGTGLTYSLQSNTNPALVTTSVSGGNLTLSYTSNASGSASINIRGTDSGGLYAETTFTVTVNPVNDNPTTSGIANLTVNEDAANSVVNLLTSFSDIEDGTGLTYSVQANTNPGLVTPSISGGNLTLSYAADGNGSANITIRGTDLGGLFVETILTVTVNPVNDAPVISGVQGSLATAEDTPLTITLGDLVVIDIDNTYPTGFSLTVLTGTNYKVSGNTITPSANFNGTLTVPVKVNDGALDSNVQNLTVTVNPVNNAPVISGVQGSLATAEDTPLTITLGNLIVTDVDNTYPADFTLTVLTGTNYAVSGNTITPSLNFNGTLTVLVKVNDGALDSNVYNLTVTVNSVNDPPVISEISEQSIDEDTVAGPLNFTVSDLETLAENLTLSASSSDTALIPDGNIVFGGSGTNRTVTVTPVRNGYGLATITLTVSDGELQTEAAFQLTVGIVTFDISGQITYYSNDIPISDVVMTLTSPDDPAFVETSVTDSEGKYAFYEIRSENNYVCAPSKPGNPGTEGISGLDVSRIARAAVGLYEFDEIRKLAGDVTGNGRISGLDASRVVRYMLGIITDLNDTGNHWTFSPASAEYIYLDSDKTDQNFLAIRLGDVSGNYLPFSKDLRGFGNPVGLTDLRGLYANQNEEVSVPIILENETAIEGVDIIAEFDGNIMEPTGVTLSGGILEYADYSLESNTDIPGEISVMIFANSEPISGSGTLANLNFRVIGEPSDGTLIELTKLVCNEIPLSDTETKRQFVLRETSEVSETSEVFMRYDLNHDGKVGLQDAVYALSIGDLNTAIRALQIMTGM